MDEDFEILYDDDVIDFPDDLPQIEEIHQEENGQTTPTMNTSPIFENDPNGGVIVTDIFGGEHHYMNMEQAQTLTDFMSGLPMPQILHLFLTVHLTRELFQQISTLLMICHFMTANYRMRNTGLTKLWMMQHIQQMRVNWKML